jgi:C1A family cysteine protease
MRMKTKRPLGWLRDLPDVRDYAPDNPKVQRASDKASAVADWFRGSRAMNPEVAPPSEVNLARFCSPIEDQGQLGSCTAQAGAGLIEYFENRAFGRHLDASRLFLYKVTRNLLGWTGDTGAYLRTTMKAMALFGVLPEEEYEYAVDRFDDEPTAFAYAYAANYRSIQYFRLDQPGMTGTDVLQQVKQFLVAGYPSMFGFTVYNFGNSRGEFEYPTSDDRVLGGHAVVAIGYDDSRRIGSHQGALRIRNSWGTDWGDAGYGWLPYEYVKTQQAVDFWSLFKMEYVATNHFD